MTPQEYLYSYCQLHLHEYTHEEAEKIIRGVNN